jgi:hypothetical protein
MHHVPAIRKGNNFDAHFPRKEEKKEITKEGWDVRA